jgi:hypothetical protein
MVISAFSPPKSASAQGERRFRFRCRSARPAGTPPRTVLRRQAGFRGAQAPGNSAQGRLLTNHPFAETLFQAQQLRLLIFHQRGERHAGPVGITVATVRTSTSNPSSGLPWTA